MVSAGTYILGILGLAVVGLALGFTAYRLRRRLLPEWEGAPARLVEAVVGIALLIWIGELLGTLQILYGWVLVVVSVGLAATSAALSRGEGPRPAGPVAAGDPPPPAVAKASSGAVPPTTPPAGEASLLAWLVTTGVVALVFAHWGLTTKSALDRGIFNFDSLWYHMPFAVEMAKSHSTTGLHYTETVFTNWLYPQNSELLHAVGILLTQRDTLSLFLNFGFLGLAFLAAWCIGRPYGRGHLTVVAAAIVLECHTLVVREPGAAKNDLVAAALLLAAAAILVNAWRSSRGWRGGGRAEDSPWTARSALSPPRQDPGAATHWALDRAATHWAVAAAGLAAGLAVGTKSTALAMAAALTVAVIVLAPTGRRWATFGWWFVPALLGGGYWYLRNLIVAGNPLPQATSIGPVPLPHPERLQEGRPDFSIVHYLTDTGVWREYFGPGLEQAFGALWPLVLAAAVAGGLLALARPRDRALRWMGAVALFGLLAYLFTPLSAAGAEGAPTGFGINIRYAVPALLLGLALLPLARGLATERRQWAALAALLAVLVLTNRADAVLRDPDRAFAIAFAFAVVIVPATLAWAYARTAGRLRLSLAAAAVAWALTVLALGYPIQRDYLRDRFAAGSDIPGMDLEPAFRWARGVEDARVGLAGTTAGFLQYGFYGTDLSNRVVYLGERGSHAAFNAIPTCAAFRAAVNAADLDYLVTAPFLNFLHPSDPIPSPEDRWLRGDDAAVSIKRNGPVTIWKLKGKLDSTACGPANAPLRRIPDTPKPQAQ